MKLNSLQQEGTEQPFRLSGKVLLWDIMIRFPAHNLLQGLRMLAIADAMFDRGKKAVEISADLLADVVAACRNIAVECKKIGMPLSAITANTMLARFEREKKADEATHFFTTELGNRLRDELASRALFCIPPEKVTFYEPSAPPFGDEVNSGFSSVQHDVSEAGACLALGRNTACVFHCMRILEAGVNALAVSLGISQPIEHDRTWGKVLRKVKDQVDLREKSKDPAWKVRTPLLENSYIFLHAAKNAWRDDTMHLANKYDEQDAERILTATRMFMQELARLIDEKGAFKLP